METLNAVFCDDQLVWLDKKECPSWFIGDKTGYVQLRVRVSKAAAAHAVDLFMKDKREKAWIWLKMVSQSMECV